ncbi:MAG: MBL fold metallo-hydrolase [Candidatus Aenigmarchaeota archaeon]|nr:MBL fold metallo-hydrolase [Candidatus Aenigmarchaeota archaeon]
MNRLFMIIVVVIMTGLFLYVTQEREQKRLETLFGNETAFGASLLEDGLSAKEAQFVVTTVHREQAFHNGTYTVHFINVSQGDATLLEFGNATMLVDCGNSGHGDDVVAYLKTEHISVIDYLVVTHADADHVGGCATVLKQETVKHIFENGQSADTKTFQAYRLASQDSPVQNVSRGFFMESNGVLIEVLGPPQQEVDVTKNDQSVILKIVGKNTTLLTGDCGYRCEQELVEKQIPIRADVYKAGHHGSQTSSTPLFLDHVDARMVVISVGKGNSYGHPNAETLERFAERQMNVHRTDYEGTVVVQV